MRQDGELVAVLVVQLRRFLVLQAHTGPTSPADASARGCCGLTGQWAAEHGYRPLLAEPQVQLAGALVTADPLHHKEATVRVLLDKGGDYLIGTKENTSQRLAAATQTLAGTPF